jgi:hypothetical protein
MKRKEEKEEKGGKEIEKKEGIGKGKVKGERRKERGGSIIINLCCKY